MKSGAISAIVVLVLIVLAIVYWLEININPNITIPPAPTQPAHNAYDDFVAARALDRDSDKWFYAGGNRPPDYKSPYADPDDRYYSLAEKQALLKENLPMIAKIREGLSYPYAGPGMWPYWNRGISSFREEARMLNFAGVVYYVEGDWDQAIRSQIDGIALGEKISEHGAIIDSLVGIACQAIGRHHAWDTIDHLSGVQARSAAQRLAAIQQAEYPLPEIIENEKWHSIDNLLHAFNAKGWNGTIVGAGAAMTVGSRATFRDYIRFLGTSKRAVTADYMRYMDAFADRCRMSYRASQREPKLRLPPDPIGSSMAEIMEGYRFRFEANEAQNDLLIVALALQAYKVDHRSYPASLSQLVPAYLRAVPADPFAASGPIRYRKTATKYVLYSVGPDGNDDGGKPIDKPGETGRARYFAEQDSVGDIVAGVNS